MAAQGRTGGMESQVLLGRWAQLGILDHRCSALSRDPISNGQLCMQGERGERGDTGPRGSKGETGEQGPAGQQGPSGTPVSACHIARLAIASCLTSLLCLPKGPVWDSWAGGTARLSWKCCEFKCSNMSVHVSLIQWLAGQPRAARRRWPVWPSRRCCMCNDWCM